MGRVTEILNDMDPDTIENITRILLCFMIICLGFFVKTIFLRWIVLKCYLRNLVLVIKRFRKYESWLKMITGKQIFSQRVKHFLDINSLHQQNHADFGLVNLDESVAFTLEALRDFDSKGYRHSAQNKDREEHDDDQSMSEDAHESLHNSVNGK